MQVKLDHDAIVDHVFMDTHLSTYAERRAPRYTSYPSANHFGPGVDAGRYESWLRALDAAAAVSLYVHIPYCRQICWYCGCNTFQTNGRNIADFVTSLMKEIELVASVLGSRKVVELRWGGGTPNVMQASDFLRLKHHIDRCFDIEPNADHAIELDPRHVTQELADAYATAGVTSASLGVQDLNAHVQRAIGRVQPFKQVHNAVDSLCRAGITTHAFDLMYGLPGQSGVDLARSLRLAVLLKPSRIALFGYAHVPWFKRRQRLIDGAALPDAGERLAQLQLGSSLLRDLGYEAVGLDHFAKPDDALAKAARLKTLHRNFQGYVARASDALVGFGPSAISRLPDGYAQNISTVSAWRESVHMGKLPISRGHAFSGEDLRGEAVIQSIMCQLWADLSPWGGWDAFPHARRVLEPLVADGIAEISNQTVGVPEPMRSFCRLVAMAFDAYATASPNAHSRAV